MIVGSLLLILIAVALLVGGLASGSSVLLVSSIAASLLAATTLVVGARQAAAARADGPYPTVSDAEPGGEQARGGAHRRRGGAPAGDPVDVDAGDYGPPPAAAVPDPSPAAATADDGRASAAATAVHDPPSAAAGPRSSIPGQVRVDPAGEGPEVDPGEPRHGEADYDADYDDDEDPPDEPAAQYVTPAEAARVARLAGEVFVIDGRPRYHLSSCLHLLGRVSEPLPVGEAVDLGFSPCSLCEPTSALLAGAPRI